jgi:hypothetical protein
MRKEEWMKMVLIAMMIGLAVVTRHAAAKGGQRQVTHQLRKDELALVHRSTPQRGLRTRCAGRNRCSNRDQRNESLSASFSKT